MAATDAADGHDMDAADGRNGRSWTHLMAATDATIWLQRTHAADGRNGRTQLMDATDAAGRNDMAATDAADGRS